MKENSILELIRTQQFRQHWKATIQWGNFEDSTKRRTLIENDDREWVDLFYNFSLMLEYDRSQRGNHKRDLVPYPFR